MYLDLIGYIIVPPIGQVGIHAKSISDGMLSLSSLKVSISLCFSPPLNTSPYPPLSVTLSIAG